MKEVKERQISPRSLENLKLGAKARYEGKIRRNTTLLPDTIRWLDAHGNASFMIDELVKSAIKGDLKFSNHAHDNGASHNAHNKDSQQADLEQALATIKKLEAELDEKYQAITWANERLNDLLEDAETFRLRAEKLEEEKQRPNFKSLILGVLAILGETILMKPNAGGAIKKKNKEAIALLEAAL